MIGWVYVISTQSHSYVKVGMTARNPKQRAKELSDTSSPHPHSVEYSVLVDNPRNIEREFHRRNEATRVSQNREWFDLDVDVAISNLLEIVGDRVISENLDLDAADLQKIESDHDLKMRRYVEKISEQFEIDVSREMEIIRSEKRQHELKCAQLTAAYDNLNWFQRLFRRLELPKCTYAAENRESDIRKAAESTVHLNAQLEDDAAWRRDQYLILNAQGSKVASYYKVWAPPVGWRPPAI